MAKLVALYRKPADIAAFDAYYYKTHVPLAKKIMGLRRHEVNIGPVMTPSGESPYHIMAVLSFDSLDSIHQALRSPEGKAATADLANFAQAGVELLIFGTKTV
jgi:uncharacterized protein (TIGR02118 family)